MGEQIGWLLMGTATLDETSTQDNLSSKRTAIRTFLVARALMTPLLQMSIIAQILLERENLLEI